MDELRKEAAFLLVLALLVLPLLLLLLRHLLLQAGHSPPSAKCPVASAEHTMDELRKAAAFLLAVALLTVNFGPAIYQSRDDIESMASVAVSYFILVLLFVWRLGSCEPRHDSDTSGRGGRWLKAAISCLTLLLALLLAHKLARIAPPSSSVLFVAAAGATALGVGGCCAFLLHRRSWSKQPCQEVMLPLVQELP